MMSGSLVLGCIADDYTGASDLANTLTRAGLRTVQTIGVPADTLTLPAVDAVVVALKSRSIPAERAVALALDARRWLVARGAEHILFKICSTFDSTDQGNIGPVTEALRAASGGGPVLVTPAFPQTGRTMFMGHLFVGRQPLHESPLKDHPLNPMRDANLVRVLARQCRQGVGLIDRLSVAEGIDAVRRARAALGPEIGAAIIDAVADEDLATIGAAALDGPISTGASGLGLGLARALMAQGRVSPTAHQDAAPWAAVGGPAVILAGSCSAATLEQLAIAAETYPLFALDLDALLADAGGEIARALAFVDQHLGNGAVIIASSAPPERVAALQARYGRDAVGHAIEAALADSAAGVMARGVRRLVVAGGESSGAVVDRLGIPAFLVGREIAPGVPVLRTTGQGDDRLMALKSGNFGGRDFFAKALTMMP